MNQLQGNQPRQQCECPRQTPPSIKILRGPSMSDEKQPSRRKGHRPSALYSAKIIKAGALIGDTKTLLSHWDVNTSPDANLHRIQRANFFGKASRSRVED